MNQVIVSETKNKVIVDDEVQIVTAVEDHVQVVTVAQQGPQGPPGTGDKTFAQPFSSATSVTVHHNLAKFPAVSVVDTSNDEVEGFVEYLDANNVLVTFSAPFSGTIFCN